VYERFVLVLRVLDDLDRGVKGVEIEVHNAARLPWLHWRHGGTGI
jgi:hypothetical protein